MAELEKLIPIYYDNKHNLDFYKKECDAQNAEIKKAMAEQKITELESEGIIAKYVIQKKESFDEDKLLTVLKDKGYTDIIRTKEYVDMDALEDALYHDTLDKDTIIELDKCRVTKEVVQLRLSKKKENRK